MNSFEEGVKTLSQKIPFRDFVILIGGFGSILFFQLIIGLDLLDQYQLTNIGRVENDIVFLVVAYVVGKILLLTSELLITLASKVIKGVAFLLRSGPFKIWKRVWLTLVRNGDWRTKFADFIDPPPKSMSPDDLEQTIPAYDMHELISRNPRVLNTFETSHLAQVFFEIAASATLIAGLFFSPPFILVSVAFFYSVYDMDKENSERWMDVFMKILKKTRAT